MLFFRRAGRVVCRSGAVPRPALRFCASAEVVAISTGVAALAGIGVAAWARSRKGSVVELSSELVVDRKAHLGEGAVWDTRRHQLLWLDILGAKVFCYDPAVGTNSTLDFSKFTEHITTIVPVHGSLSEVVVGTTEGIAKFDLDKGPQSWQEHSDNGNVHGQFVRMNDGKCDPQGRLWIGSIARVGPDGADLLERGSALYVYQGWRAAPTKVLGDITVSNGISWSADQKVMYYTDSTTFHIDAFDFDGAAAQQQQLATGRRHVIKVGKSFPPVPDGHALDTEGMLWVACFGAGEVRRYNPRNGQLLARVRLPAEAGKEATSCAFGGKDMDELYITTATEFWDEAKKKEMPLAGGLFKVPREELAQLGTVRGAPVHAFRM